MGPHLTVEQRQLARRLSAKGLSLREIGRQVGCSHEVVRAVVRGESKRLEVAVCGLGSGGVVGSVASPALVPASGFCAGGDGGLRAAA
jgi:hypothetical protein